MKKILFMSLFFLASCTTKYRTYYTIEKKSFELEKEHNPITRKMRMLPGKKQANYCADQILFSNNAKKESDRSIQGLLAKTCPNSKYLMNSKVTQTWWTVLLYSRSCIELEAYCPR